MPVELPQPTPLAGRPIQTVDVTVVAAKYNESLVTNGGVSGGRFSVGELAQSTEPSLLFRA